MAKASGAKTLSAFTFGLERPILYQDIQTVMEAMNHAVCGSPYQLVSIFADTDSGMNAAPHGDSTNGVLFDTGAAPVLRYGFWAWVDLDLDTIRVRTRAAATSPATGNVIISFAGVTITHSYSSGLSAATSFHTPISFGWQYGTVELDRSSADTSQIRFLEATIWSDTFAATSIPDPPNS